MLGRTIIISFFRERIRSGKFKEFVTVIWLVRGRGFLVWVLCGFFVWVWVYILVFIFVFV